MEVKSEKELNNLMEQVQFNNSYAQRMKKMVIESKDLEVVERTQKVMQEVNEAEQRSCSKLRMFQRRLESCRVDLRPTV